ncbi:T9SS type A sorting domain-containing protein [Algibacter sp. 2305UL17-15]|uniref:T9SS type A sorting domain-containing protein n=1 Tax=Algibacter sp. 2305UL17-15 TaxID=3231268 RepID=UPI003459FA6A
MKRITNWVKFLCIIGVFCKLGAQTSVAVNLNVKHTVGGIYEFDRSKFITIHANQTEQEWDGNNFVPDLRDDFLNGYDVYLGRDTGGITWNLNQMAEDPSRPGFANPVDITNRGLNSRNNYANKTNLHSYEARNNLIIAAQLHPFWTGESQRNTNQGWKLANPTATGEYMGRYINEFHGGNGQPTPAFVEVINEPAYEALGGKSDYTNSLQEIADFHVEVADAIRAQNPNLLIGGYTVAFPDFETGDFQRWINRDKLFIDVAGEKMDFWSMHLYDFASIGGGKKDLRSGSNIEATFDMMDNYSQIKLGKTKPYVISEYGAQMHDYFGDWSPFRDWLHLKAQNAQLMSFLERPDAIAIAVNFLIVKAEWGYNSTTGATYNHRLLRKENEPTSYTGKWVYTDMVKFYQLWQNVKGRRVDTKSTDLDIQVDAYIDGNKGYIILNNLEFNAKTIDLDIFDNYNVNVASILKRHLTLSGNAPILEEETLTSPISEVVLGAESTMILEYTFEDTITIDETSDEVKYFANDYLKPIQASQPALFNINGITKNGAYGEAVLRVSIGRDHGKILKPIVKINNKDIVVPDDWRGYNQGDKKRFFGTLEIPVSYDDLNTNNTVSLEFPDSGGHISTVGIQVFNFSANIREVNPSSLPSDNYKIKGIDATCVSQNNGAINVTTTVAQDYKASVTGPSFNQDFDFSSDLNIENLNPGTYTMIVTVPSFPDYRIEFTIEIGQPEPLSVTSKVSNSKNAVTLNLNGSNNYNIELNGKDIKTSSNEITLELTEGKNTLKVKTNKDCQGVYEETFFINKSFFLFPNPVNDELSVVVNKKLLNSTAYVYNVIGRLVKEQVMMQTQNKIPVTNLEKGVYMIVFKINDESVEVSKFVVK